MTRLTTANRKTIRDRVLAHRFKDAEDVLAVTEDALAFRVVAETFSMYEYDMIRTIPDGWLPKTKRVTCKLAEAWVSLEFIDWRPMPDFKISQCLVVLDANHPITEDFREFQGIKKAITAERKTLEKSVDAALNAVSTIKALREAWPEVEPFLHGLEKMKVNLPAIQTSDLNSALGLPVC